MAKAEVKTTVTALTLHMSIEEAQAVASVFMKVGGPPNTSRRKLIGSVLDTLRLAGVKTDTSDMESSSIMFK